MTDILQKQMELQKQRWDLIETVDPTLYKGIAAHTEKLQEQDWTGMIEDLDEDVYHQGPGFSRGMLMDVRKNPNFFHYKNVRTYEEKSSRTMDAGSMLHSAMLEPHLLHEKYVADDEIIEKVMKEKPETKKVRATALYKEQKKELVDSGKTVICYEDWERMKIQVDNLWSHPVAKNLLNAGIAESSIYARDPETGLLCRIRIDRMLNDGILIDLKSSGTGIDEDEWSKKIFNMNYHVQAAFYNAVASWAFGAQFDKFIHICVENTPPYDVAIWKIDFGTLELGEYIFRKELDRLAQCIETDKFPGYSTRINNISVPHWAFQKEIG